MLQKSRVNILALIAIISLIVGCIVFTILAQEPKQPTGYFVKVEKLDVPLDISATPIGTFVVYAKDGVTEIWRENVSLDTYINDDQLKDAVDKWGSPYIDRYEKKVALSTLVETSQIIGKVVGHTR